MLLIGWLQTTATTTPIDSIDSIDSTEYSTLYSSILD
jgi:hypothetical protein